MQVVRCLFPRVAVHQARHVLRVQLELTHRSFIIFVPPGVCVCLRKSISRITLVKIPFSVHSEIRRHSCASLGPASYTCWIQVCSCVHRAAAQLIVVAFDVIVLLIPGARVLTHTLVCCALVIFQITRLLIYDISEIRL